MLTHNLRLVVAAGTVLVLGVVLLIVTAARSRRLRPLYKRHFAETPRERLFLASLGFFLSFGVVRTLTRAIHLGVGPFHDISVGGTHIHHLVWGILLLLLVGYGWLVQVGTGLDRSALWVGRMMAFFYGVGAAITLDEYALFVKLRDVYWEREGRASIDAIMIFGALLSMGLYAGPLLHALSREAARLLRRG